MARGRAESRDRRKGVSTRAGITMPMLYVVVGEDAADAPRLREALLQAHFDWVLGAMDRIRAAGMWLDGASWLR